MEKIKDRELLKITSQFRSGLLGNKSPNGMCFAICAPLQSYLSICGYETELIEVTIPDWLGKKSYQHFCLQLKDGRILDPTANQFEVYDKKMPKVFLGKMPYWYHSPHPRNSTNP